MDNIFNCVAIMRTMRVLMKNQINININILVN